NMAKRKRSAREIVLKIIEKTPREIKEELKRAGIKVSPNYIYSIRNEMRRNGILERPHPAKRNSRDPVMELLEAEIAQARNEIRKALNARKILLEKTEYAVS